MRLPVGPDCHHAVVPAWSLDEIARAIRASWAVDTCDPVDACSWSTTNPATGQCGPTALVINDLLGGELMLAEVTWPDGTRQGCHYWNRLPDGTHVDLTLDQFTAGERVQEGRPVVRPAGEPRRCAQEYRLLRERVMARLRDVDAGDHDGRAT